MSLVGFGEVWNLEVDFVMKTKIDVDIAIRSLWPVSPNAGVWAAAKN